MALIVKLNGNNYVSDKTKGAFTHALQDAESKKQEVAPETQRLSERIDEKANHELRITNYDSQTLSAKQPATSFQQPASSFQQPASSFQQPASSFQLPASSNQFLARLDHALDQSYEHQTLTMRVHEQYLNNQSDYASIFSQLMQQQGAIFTNTATTPQQAESAATILETLSRSMTRFHDLQEQTLDVHKQFLAQQSDYARATLQLLKEQHTTVAKGNGNGNGHYPVMESKAQSPKSKVGDETNYELQITPTRSGANYDTQTSSAEQPASSIQRPASSFQQPEPTNANTTTTTLNTEALTTSLLSIVSDKTGYPADMLELDMDMEADLGIDSIKRVEILGALQEQHPDLPDVETDVLAELRTLAQIVAYMGETANSDLRLTNYDTQVSSVEKPESSIQLPASSFQPPESASTVKSETTLNTEALTSSLLAIVSDKTGYPADMLELDMDMEADLGIDSIKRVEILGALQEENPDLPEVETDVLAEFRTLGQIVDYMQPASSIQHPASSIQHPATKKSLTRAAHGIARREVRLRALPAPDFLELNLPEGHCCLVNDVGSLSDTLAVALAARGWHVALWHPVADEAQMQAQLANIIQTQGSIAAFVNLSPANTGDYFSVDDEAHLKQSFLMAKHLKASLTQAAQNGYAAFMSVTRLDGALGKTGNGSSVAGGHFGLTKTLALEWRAAGPHGVFCRAVDVAPDFDEQQAVQAIIAELHDPNRRLVELGWSKSGRVTLTT